MPNQFLDNQTGKQHFWDLYLPASLPPFSSSDCFLQLDHIFGTLQKVEDGIQLDSLSAHISLKGMGGPHAFIIFLGQSWDKETLLKPIPFHMHLIIQPCLPAKQGTRQRQGSAAEFKHAALVFPQTCAWLTAPDGSL